MIGNDIVDLKQASIESNWERKGFLNKIFTQKEKEYILTSQDSHKMVWRLWSMKESAYKIYTKEYQKRLFNPKSFQSEILNDSEGKVNIENSTYFTISNIGMNYIYTTSVSSVMKRITTRFFTTKINDHRALSHKCYTNLKKTVASQTRIKQEALTVKKDNIGVPYLYFNNEFLDVPFSITHHGNYGAFVISES